MELIYSRQDSDFIKGRAYANPRFYSRPRDGVTKVYLVGEWPKIEADYQALGVEVVKLSDGTSVTASAADAPPAVPAPTFAPAVDPGSVEIPDDWRELPWPQLRKLGASFAAVVLNKAEATAAIEGELARRAAEANIAEVGATEQSATVAPLDPEVAE